MKKEPITKIELNEKKTQLQKLIDFQQKKKLFTTI